MIVRVSKPVKIITLSLIAFIIVNIVCIRLYKINKYDAYSAVMAQTTETFTDMEFYIMSKDQPAVIRHLKSITPEGMKQSIVLDRDLITTKVRVRYAVDINYLDKVKYTDYSHYVDLYNSIIDYGYLIGDKLDKDATPTEIAKH